MMHLTSCGFEREDTAKHAEELLFTLLRENADPNVVNHNGFAALSILMEYGNHRVVDATRLLLTFRADPHFAFNGEMPLQIATRRGLTEVARVLERWPQLVTLRTACIRAIYAHNVDRSHLPPLHMNLPYEDEERDNYDEIEAIQEGVRERKRKREEEEKGKGRRGGKRR